MADVSVYKRATTTYAGTLGMVRAGEVRLASDSVVLATPGMWVAVTDADMTSGKKYVHDAG